MQAWEILIVVNGLVFLLMWKDKWAARKGNWRVPEGVLLGLTAMGGTPATLLARWLFRHKTKKGSFVGRLYFIILLQLLGLGAWAFGLLPA